MKVMDHSEYPKSLKSKTDEQLLFIIKDCQEALVANPDNQNAGYYSDEICYCSMEWASRSKTEHKE